MCIDVPVLFFNRLDKSFPMVSRMSLHMSFHPYLQVSLHKYWHTSVDTVVRHDCYRWLADLPQTKRWKDRTREAQPHSSVITYVDVHADMHVDMPQCTLVYIPGCISGMRRRWRHVIVRVRTYRAISHIYMCSCRAHEPHRKHERTHARTHVSELIGP